MSPAAGVPRPRDDAKTTYAWEWLASQALSSGTGALPDGETCDATWWRDQLSALGSWM